MRTKLLGASGFALVMSCLIALIGLHYLSAAGGRMGLMYKDLLIGDT